jgi:hypothetical protein
VADKFEGIPKAMTELIMDRFVGEEGQEAFNCVPMRIGENVIAISFVLARDLVHVTPDDVTQIPAGTAITMIVQEFIIGDGSLDIGSDIEERTTTLWPLKNIMEG